MSRLTKHYERYKEFIPDFDEFMAAVKRDQPARIRVNTLKTTVAEVERNLTAKGFEVERTTWNPYLLTIKGDRPKKLGSTLMHSLGHYYVQSASSSVAALALDVKPGHRVLDLCASPGSKTTFIAQLLEGKGLVVANEPSRKRLTPLTTNLRRLGITNAVTTTYSGQNFPMRLKFDRVLVDAPCSGEGTWRGPDARPKNTSESLRERLVKRQQQILERGIQTMAPDGQLVYSTCTYAPEENENVVGPLAAKYDLEILDTGLKINACPGLTQIEGVKMPDGMEKALRLYPHRFDSEGFFVIRMARR